MAWFTRSSRCTILALVWTLGLSVNLLEQVQAQPLTSPLGSKLENAFRPPRGSGPRVPVNTLSGGRRGSPCEKKESKPFLALVPAPIQGETSGIGETMAAYPTIYWYMPTLSADKAEAPAMEFVLKDANDQEVYSAQYDLTKSATGVVGTPGIMSLTIDRLYPLKVGQEYRWQLTLRCDANSSDRSEDDYIEGRLKRVERDPNVTERAQQANLQERVAMYAEEKLWYETLDALYALRRDYPYDQNLADAWEKLLSAAGLQLISKEPLFQSASNINNYNQ